MHGGKKTLTDYLITRFITVSIPKNRDNAVVDITERKQKVEVEKIGVEPFNALSPI